MYRNCFWHSEQFLYTCFPHVLQKEELLTKIYLYSEDDISTVSEEVIVVTSTNGQMIFEIEDPLEEQKAKKTKISDEKMF